MAPDLGHGMRKLVFEKYFCESIFILEPEVKFKKPQISCGTEYELRV
jgi:hypothetical protein